MNRWHSDEFVGLDMSEPCPGPPCDRDHFVVISDSQWCDPEFISDRLRQLRRRT